MHGEMLVFSSRWNAEEARFCINRVATTTATIVTEVVTRSVDSRQDVKVRRKRAKAFSSEFLIPGPLPL